MKKFYILLFSFILILVSNTEQANAEAGFTDVSSFKEEIKYLAEKNIISGYGDGSFRPEKTVTRGDAALMIARALDLDTTLRNTEFPDVPLGKTASGAIQSAADQGIIKGYTDGTFKPDALVNRGEMAIFIARAFKLTDEEVISFSDVSISSSSYSSIRNILAFGVTEGYTDGTFRPDKPLNRSQFSAFLARALSEQFRLNVNICGYNPDSRKNPDRQIVNCLLTRSALDAGIPPEIVKAVATVENGSWKHFETNGEPVITDDGGIGLMQITNTKGYDLNEINRLKYDLTFNISEGVKVLATNFKRTDLPSVADKNPKKLQSWYFAVLLYNGTVAVNSPIIMSTGERNHDAYQEKVFNIISNSYFETNLTSMNMTADDFRYDETTDWKIIFVTNHFPLPEADQTLSKEMFKVGSTVRYSGKGLRLKPSASSDLIQPTTVSDSFEIIGGLVYDINKDSKNNFAWYPVKLSNKTGKTVTGYIATQSIE